MCPGQEGGDAPPSNARAAHGKVQPRGKKGQSLSHSRQLGLLERYQGITSHQKHDANFCIPPGPTSNENLIIDLIIPITPTRHIYRNYQTALSDSGADSTLNLQSHIPPPSSHPPRPICPVCSPRVKAIYYGPCHGGLRAQSGKISQVAQGPAPGAHSREPGLVNAPFATTTTLPQPC